MIFFFFLKRGFTSSLDRCAVFFLMPLCCVDAKEVRFSGEQVLRFRFGRLGDLVVRHSGQFVRREATGGPCSTRVPSHSLEDINVTK